MTIEVNGKQFAALVRGDAVAVGPSKRVITLDDGPFVVNRSYPDPHCGRPGEVGGSAPRDECADGDEPREKVKYSKTQIDALKHHATHGYTGRAEEYLLGGREDIDEERIKDKPYLYISSFRPLGSWANFPEGVYFSDRMVWSEKPLPLKTIYDLELGAVNDRAQGILWKELYEAQNDPPVGDEHKVWVFIRRTEDNYKGFIIHPSTDADEPPWRASYFDLRGFSGHSYYQTPEKAIGDQVGEHLWTIKPSLFESISKQESFTIGNARTMLRQQRRGEGVPFDKIMEEVQEKYPWPKGTPGVARAAPDVDIEESEDLNELAQTVLGMLGLLPIVERGGPGSGFHGHVGRLGEVGGSAHTQVGRPPLPAGGRESPEAQPRNILKPPPELETISLEDANAHIKKLIDTARLIKWGDERAEARFANDASRLESLTLDEDPSESVKNRLITDFYWLYQRLLYETEGTDALEGLRPNELQEFEDVGEILENYVPGHKPLSGTAEDQWDEEWYIAGFDDPTDEGGYVFSKYQEMIPDRIRNNPLMFRQYQEGVLELLNGYGAGEELYPFHETPEGDVPELFVEPFVDIDLLDNGWEIIHPDVQRAISEAWRKRAMTEGTPENSQSVKNGGADPQIWIESMAAFMSQAQWSPAEYLNTELYETADAINAGWQQSTATPGGQLAMEAAERLFVPMTGAEAPPRSRNKVVELAENLAKKEAGEAYEPYFGDELEQNFKIGQGQYEKMSGADVIEYLDDPARQEYADDVIEEMYDDTQAWFQQLGFGPNDRIPLYRGQHNITGPWNPEGEASDEAMDTEIDLYSLSSWTTNVLETAPFTGREAGAIIKAMIPVNRILAIPQTGFPCKEELEFVVIGGPGIRGTVYDGSAHTDAIVHDLVGDYGPQWRLALKDQLEGGWYRTPDYQPLPGGVVKAMDVGGGFSVPEDSEMKVSGGGRKFTIPADETAEDWISEKLAAFDLDRGLVDRTSTTDAEGNELEPEEIKLLLDRYYIAKRRAVIKDKKILSGENKQHGPVVQRSYPAPHCGRKGEVGGSAPRDECAAGATPDTDGVGAPAKEGKAVFSHPMPNEDALISWFEAHRVPADKIEAFATTSKHGMLSQFTPEDREMWLKRRELLINDTLEELEGVNWEIFDKEEFLRSDEKYKLLDAINELSDNAKEQGNEELEDYYREISSELYMSDRFSREAIEFAILRAVANGEVSVEVAGEIDYHAKRPHGEWSSMPETLYHTTTAGSAIRETGIKSRFELTGGESALGGGDDKSISYTASEEWARAIERTIQEAQQVGAGEVTAADLMTYAAQGVGNKGEGFLSNLIALGSSKIGAIFREDPEAGLRDYLNSPDFDPTQTVPEEFADAPKVQAWIDFHTNPDTVKLDLGRIRARDQGDYGDWVFLDAEEKAQEAASIPDEAVQVEMRERAWDLFKYQYTSARQYAGGHLNPLIWGGSPESFAAIDPNEIVTFIYKPKEGALGVKQSALDEWRSYGSDNVDVVEEKNLFDVSDLWTEKSLIQRAFDFIKRGGPGSGFFEHVGREGEVGGSAPEGTPGFQRPGMSAYGSGVFTPLLKDVIYGWQDQDRWGTAQMIYTNVVRAQKQGDKDYEGLAIGEDGILQGIGALDYNATDEEFEKLAAEDLPEFDIAEYLKIDGLYTPDPAFSEELIIQMAAEAAKHGKGLWMKTTDKSGPFAAQMGMSIVGEAYAYWTPEQVAQVAETATGMEPTDYYAPPSKPRITMGFSDAYEESIPSNPITGQPAPASVSEMSPEDRYRWENFNYTNWAQPESWNPKEMAKEQLGLGEEEEPTNLFDVRVSEDLQHIHDGWIDGTDSPWSVRFSEAVAGVFGGDPIPESRPRDEYDTPQEFLDVLAGDYGTDVVMGGDSPADWNKLDEEEQWERLDEFNAFASGAREEDIATDLYTVVQSMYDTTQAKFKEVGFSPGDTVRLYRGLQSEPEEKFEGHDGGWVNIEQWAVSSWSAAKIVAGNFATMEGEYSTEDGTGTLLTADIPIEKILANWQTGPGSHGEFEYLVLGEGGIDSYATKVESSRRYASVKEGKEIEAGTPPSGEYAVGPEIE